jgi:predicted DNA-binding transcriptional regulator AlpA
VEARSSSTSATRAQPSARPEPQAREQRLGDRRLVAKVLGLSVSMVAKLDVSGRLPAPLHFGRAVRWDLTELDDWIRAGAPNRDRWNTIRGRAR